MLAAEKDSVKSKHYQIVNIHFYSLY